MQARVRNDPSVGVPGDSKVEFVSPEEVHDLLEEYGIEEVPDEGGLTYLDMFDGDGVVHIHIACATCDAIPRDGATVVPIKREQLADVIERVLQRLRLSQVLAIPVSKWRRVFDTVAFSLAQNEEWQEIDATATVEMNTRDPLLFEPGDVHTLIALTKALLKDADQPDQGLTFLSTHSPVLLEVDPAGAVRISLGSQVLADQCASVFA